MNSISQLILLMLSTEAAAISLDLITDPTGCLHAVNKVRARHGVPSLVWDATLAHGAMAWAVSMASHNKFDMSTSETYGELLYNLWGKSEPSLCEVAVHAWYSQIDGYKFEKPEYSDEASGFIHLTWKDVRQIGIAIVYAQEKRQTWIVARLAPKADLFRKDISNYVLNPNPGISIPTTAELKPPRLVPPYAAKLEVSSGEVRKACEDVRNEQECLQFKEKGYCTGYYGQWSMENCYRTCTGCTPQRSVDGGWSKWVDMQQCQKPCTVLQHRFCINPEPFEGGKPCAGEGTRTVACSTGGCGPIQQKVYG